MRNSNNSSPSSPKTPPLLGREEELSITPPTDEYQEAEVLSFPTTPIYTEGESGILLDAPNNTPLEDVGTRRPPASVTVSAARWELREAIANPTSTNKRSFVHEESLNIVPDAPRRPRRIAMPNTLAPINTQGEGGDNYQLQFFENLFNQLNQPNNGNQQMHPQGGNPQTQTQTHNVEADQADIYQEHRDEDSAPTGGLDSEQNPSQRPQSPRSPGSPQSQFSIFRNSRQ